MQRAFHFARTRDPKPQATNTLNLLGLALPSHLGFWGRQTMSIRSLPAAAIDFSVLLVCLRVRLEDFGFKPRPQTQKCWSSGPKTVCEEKGSFPLATAKRKPQPRLTRHPPNSSTNPRLRWPPLGEQPARSPTTPPNFSTGPFPVWFCRTPTLRGTPFSCHKGLDLLRKWNATS